MVAAADARLYDRLVEAVRARLDSPLDLADDPYRQSSLNPPSWRGRLHAAMLVPAAFAGALAVVATPGVRARVVVALYAGSLVLMFAVSAWFHLRRWDDDGWLRGRSLDHSAIFLLIAGCYGAIMGLGVRGWPQTWLVGVALGLVAVSLWLRRVLLNPRFGLMTTLFLLSGGVSMLAIVEIWRSLGALGTTVVLIGCACYGAGAMALGLRRPDPWPRRFGYHEVWHLNVTIAAGCHWWVVAYVVVPSL